MTVYDHARPYSGGQYTSLQWGEYIARGERYRRARRLSVHLPFRWGDQTVEWWARGRRAGVRGGEQVDFIVLGGVLGAVVMVAGTVLRDLMPRRLRIAGDDTPWVDVRDRRRTVRSALVGGRLATIAGVLVLLATALLVVLDPSDGIALTVVVGLTVAGVLGCVGWVVWYRYQESSGAIQRRQMRLIASRLSSPVRPPATQHRRAHEDRPDTRFGAPPARAQERQRRQDPERGERPAGGNGRPGDGAGRSTAVTDREPSRLPRGTGNDSMRQELQPDHRPIAPQHDRSQSPRPPTRDPLHRAPHPPIRSERPGRDVPSASRPRRSES